MLLRYIATKYYIKNVATNLMNKINTLVARVGCHYCSSFIHTKQWLRRHAFRHHLITVQFQILYT